MMSVPSASTITSEGFQQALSLYTSLVESVYKSKIKDSKKVSEALDRDRWRFEELPSTVAQMKTNGKSPTSKSNADIHGGGLSKKAVERLVQWKITHGQSRPFLPAMVRKNDASTIQTCTLQAFEKLSSSPSSEPPSTPTVKAALDAVCKLNGIGPATGTLILNVFDPVHIPFFQDEMFAWFFPDSKGDKLKYNQKEYLQLLETARSVLARLGVKAVELEKVSYVLGHLDLLDPTERKKLEHAFASNTTGQVLEDRGEPQETDVGSEKIEATSLQQKPPRAKKEKTQGAKREADADEDMPPTKRRSQRKR